MSTHLKYDAHVIALGSTIYDAIVDMRTTLTSVGWQVVQESKAITSYLGPMTTPGNAFDASPTTSATSAAALPLQLGVQAAAAFTATKLSIIGPSNATFAPKDFTIEYSDNGSAWTTAATVTSETSWFGYERKTYAWTAAGSHAYWRINVSARNGGATLEVIELMFEDASGNVLSGIASMVVIPPSSETIGNSKARDVLRFEINALGTLLTIIPTQQMLQDHPQIFQLYDKTAGAVACACTINGVTVTGATGSAGSTAAQNLRALYEAIRESADANFTAYDWSYNPPAPQNAVDATVMIYGVQNTPGTNLSFSVNANTNGFQIASYTKATVAPCTCYIINTNLQMTIDLINGFIPYFQINSRSLGLGIKTPTNYYGPIHACWGDNAKAVASMPANGGVHVTPIELIVGTDNTSANLNSTGYFGHVWTLPSNRQTVALGSYLPQGAGSPGNHTFGNYGLRDRFFDGIPYVSVPISVTLFGSGVWTTTDSVGDDFQVHRVMPAAAASQGTTSGFIGSQPLTMVAPILDFQDWYKFRGTASNEALIVVADNVQFSTITSNLDATTLYTTLSVADGTKFQASGGVVCVDDELFTYTGVSSNTLTGVTRGVYGSTKVKHYSGDRCAQGLWFTVINGGALLAGYNKPT